RYARKRETEWTGYKVHLTESCDEDYPHLVVNVETTPATVSDYDMTPQIHDHLADRDLLPSEHLLDGGYASADHLLTSQKQGIDLLAPVSEEKSWQARAGEGFDCASFSIDWEQNVATCPEGKTSQQGYTATQKGAPVHIFKFPRSACGSCVSQPLCTKSSHGYRRIAVQPQAAYEALQAARQRQKEEVFKQQYALRAGVEGTISQAVAVADLRRARYVGLAKTRLQHLFTALGMNVLRLGNWWAEIPPAKTRISPFASLAPILTAPT
ncbi:MAG: transposase, partial [Bacteroidota bacterium]